MGDYNLSKERIILNVGGVKYETYRSTLTAYPETLLGTMFQERNHALLHPTNDNEYFIDRNGKAFHYILEFYRTGEIIWPSQEDTDTKTTNFCCYTFVTRKELLKELDYFQIPMKEMSPDKHNMSAEEEYKLLAIKLDGFVKALLESICLARQDYQNILHVKFYDRLPTKDVPKSIHSQPNIDKLLKPYVSNIRWSLDKRFKYEPEPNYFDLKIVGNVFDKNEILKYSSLNFNL
ncbi:BTB/POZ protein [Rhizophagus irregularis DAOM 181602=DAOM 197198]|uniref:BTB/POZ protein n=1 Tax=Rhizophagus irregularis (strain DAOM 181602 / DAOM 197198 / MUCL 43194) TaxID=747089 RepID=A0A2P4QVE3_RHIID|nr:BTB/POZ protein [Rhizophagus irregularis DAOM 181602=DAOM 197198]POG81634.1 BTB/POZ protein [Rhizophagus irregularis DAOM 181602=DAOM 197198]|eukprot:XP_025188500.1 BTB/POZ protein [Rhizophagus irregularis DAOM 181602=DAOM 197198]